MLKIYSIKMTGISKNKGYVNILSRFSALMIVCRCDVGRIESDQMRQNVRKGVNEVVNSDVPATKKKLC